MRLLIKLALIPVWIVVTVCWLFAAIVSRLYELTHGFLWALLLVPVAIACILQMWQNAVVFLVIGVVSYLVLFGLSVIEMMLNSVRITLGTIITV